MRRIVAALSFTALFACTQPMPAPQPATPTSTGMLFVGGTVLSGPQQTPQKNVAIYVEGGVIREIGPATELQSKYMGRANVLAMLDATILPASSTRTAISTASASRWTPSTCATRLRTKKCSRA